MCIFNLITINLSKNEPRNSYLSKRLHLTAFMGINNNCKTEFNT